MRTKADNYIYLVKASDYLKIGTSNDVFTRIDKLKTGCPFEMTILATITGGKDKEKELHKKFKHLKVRSEWFKYSDEILSYFNVDKFIPDTEPSSFGDLVMITKGQFKGIVGIYDDDDIDEVGEEKIIIYPCNREDFNAYILVKPKHVVKISKTAKDSPDASKR